MSRYKILCIFSLMTAVQLSWRIVVVQVLFGLSESIFYQFIRHKLDGKQFKV